MRVRFISAALIACIIATALLCACGTGGQEDTADTTSTATVTEAEDTAMKDDLPEIKFNGYTYRILGQGGAGWTASDIIRPESFTEDGLNDAKLKRYMNVEERFGITIETSLSETVYTTVQGGILSNDFSFDYPNGRTLYFQIGRQSHLRRRSCFFIRNRHS